ncbi:MAG: fibronectin type III domain-containing protein, partial [Candidatus Marinimicrobia bacterium]|nr:fibronectin type III domain-containing protein [Candidatus Neomarinimicrobiota bacterium]
LVPMLENAGANVFIPRERDLQTHEVIVDNDLSSASGSYFEISSDTSITFQSAPDSSGFAIGNPPYETGVNPFRQGSYRYIASDTTATAEIQFIPEIPEDGYYAVTIAYKSLDHSVEDAYYTVCHLGGKTEFLVNQQIGGGTWIFLGKFQFRAGRNPEIGKVVLTNRSRQAESIVTADAVRFGGGMGNISREGQISGRPRYVEGARYYLQYAGMPDTLVYNLNGDSIDYNDDYQCRGEWVNYLRGVPFGPNKKRDEKGLGIPVDLSLAFHTDAGRTRTGIVVGTLSIYNTDGADSTLKFPDGQSRLANRDLADILQTQIVDDIQAKYDPLWNRRALWDRGYSEAWRPNVPSVLLELLSHHNYLDMKFGNDPRFRFDASRAIYKAFLRFMATQYQTDYVVQPLPVSYFQAEFVNGNNVALRWKPVIDPLEITAMTDKYILYTRLDDKDFDNGKLVNSNNVTLRNIRPGVIYSFKVTAVNDGGESFPSEILSVCYLDGSEKPVCIVNGFDRVAPPATLETDEYLGFANFWDQGVADGYELAFTGDQYDLSADSPWLDDDSPGHGASNADYECTVVAGNTHDFVYTHGKSIRSAGYSFVSAGDEAVMDGAVDLAKYDIVDIIMGEEKLTEGPKPFLEKQFEVFPVPLQESLKIYCQSGGSIFISGAYIGTDPFVNVQDDSASINFVQSNLKYKWRTDHAVKTGGVYSVDSLFMPFGNSFEFNTLLNPSLYAVESPDAIEPADTTAVTILRYRENNTSAAVGFKGDYSVVAFGFPFETIPDQGKRDEVMQAILNYLKK